MSTKINYRAFVHVIKSRNFIYYDLSKLLKNVHDIVLIEVYHENVLIQKLKYRANVNKFEVFNSGNYSIKIYFNTFDNLRTNVRTNLIDFSVTEIKRIIASKVQLNQKNNYLQCDISHAELFFNSPKAYYLYKNGKIISKINSTSTNHMFYINKSGHYKIVVYFITSNGVTSSVASEEVNFERQVFTSGKINKKRGDLSSSLSLMLRIVWAFTLREFQRKYNTGYFGYFSIVIGPLVQVGALVVIYTFLGKSTNLGLSIPVFVLTGLVPYNYLSSATTGCLAIVQSNRGLLNYRQVKIIDVIFAKVLMEYLLSGFTFIGGLSICYFIGYEFKIYNLLSICGAALLIFILSLALGLIFAVVGFYFVEIHYAIQIIFRILFYISGVFFSIDNVPVQYQRYFLWNPLLQLIEYIRFSFVGFNLPYELSYVYLIKISIFLLILGMSLYFINRHKFLVNDQARF